MNLVERLRASATQARAIDRAGLLAEAADEIERMAGDAEVLRLQLQAAHAEAELIRAATLTDEEREVLVRVADDASYRALAHTERVVRGILERFC